MYPKGNKELEILKLYTGNYKRRLYLREISKLAEISLKATQNAVAALEEKRVLKSVVEGKNKYLFLNLENIQTKFLLLQAELYKTAKFVDKYPIFKTFIKELGHENTLIAFGSFARFSAGKDSDLDLLVISEKESKLPFHLLPYKIHEIRMKHSSFLKAFEKKENLVKEVEENHILFNNISFFVDIMWDNYGQQ